jgi:PAS domain S-box-containing protein
MAEVTQLQEALRVEIAAHQRTKEALRDSEMQFRAIAHSANDAIIAADGQGQITFWSKGAQKIFGYTESEMVGQPLTNLMPERYKAAHQSGIERFRSSGQANIIGKTVEFEGLRKNAHEFPLELSLSTWMTGGGPFFSGIIRDVTGRKEAEKLLSEQDTVLHTLMDILPDYIYIKDTHKGQVINNVAHVRLWGQNGGTNGNHGKDDSDHSIRQLAAQYYAHEQEVIRTGQPLLNKQEPVLDPAGRRHWLLTPTVPLRDEQGEITP